MRESESERSPNAILLSLVRRRRVFASPTAASISPCATHSIVDGTSGGRGDGTREFGRAVRSPERQIVPRSSASMATPRRPPDNINSIVWIGGGEGERRGGRMPDECRRIAGIGGIPEEVHDERARRPTTPPNAPAPRARALGGDWHGVATRRLEGPNIWDVL